MKLQLAVVAEAISADPREACDGARRAGFAGLLFDAASRGLNLTEFSSSGRREFKNLLERYNQKLVGLRFDPGPRGLLPPADVDQVLSRADRVLESAAELAAGCVCIDFGPLPAPPKNLQPKPKITRKQAGLILLPESPIAERADVEPSAPYDPTLLSELTTGMARLCERADRYGVTVALSSALASFASLRQALDAVRCPSFGVDLDPVAVLRDEWDMDQIFSAFGPQIRHIRARDAVLGTDRRTRPASIGQGSVDWRRLLRSLDEAGYEGMITIDPMELPDRRAAALAAREFLTQLP